MADKPIWFTPEKVRERILSYDPESLEQLSSLVDRTYGQDLRRAEMVDQKSQLILGYCGALIVFGLPWITKSNGDAVVLALQGMAAMAALLGAVFAFDAMRARANWPGFTARSLLPRIPEDRPCGPREMRIFWTHCAYSFYERHARLTNKKADRLRWAQTALTLALLTSALALTYPTGKALVAACAVVERPLDALRPRLSEGVVVGGHIERSGVWLSGSGRLDGNGGRRFGLLGRRRFLRIGHDGSVGTRATSEAE
jgi:hypothetical protein